MDRQEYTAETYPSFGKKYNGEKAIISLTSWKARINTVAKTIYSLIKQCPGFHIVLVLSEEEFPKMMDELPENLKLFADNEMIEVLWVYKNYKAFKKVLFTMNKYKTVPIISADDDCVYMYNYADELYNTWLNHKDCCITYSNPTNFKGAAGNWGAASLYPPNFYKNLGILCLTPGIINSNLDDGYYNVLRFHLHLHEYQINKDPFKSVFKFHTKNDALSYIYLKNKATVNRQMNHMDRIIYAGIKYA